MEGISDRVAVEALAVRRGRDLDAERVAVVAIGGAQAIGRVLARFGPQGTRRRARGPVRRGRGARLPRALERAGLGRDLTRGHGGARVLRVRRRPRGRTDPCRGCANGRTAHRAPRRAAVVSHPAEAAGAPRAHHRTAAVALHGIAQWPQGALPRRCSSTRSSCRGCPARSTASSRTCDAVRQSSSGSTAVGKRSTVRSAGKARAQVSATASVAAPPRTTAPAGPRI